MPANYAKLLSLINGFLLENGLLIYSTYDAPERNETFEVKKYAPGYFAIGDDSGGRAVVIVLNNEECPVYLVDQGSMAPDDMEKLNSSLESWVDAGCPL